VLYFAAGHSTAGFDACTLKTAASKEAPDLTIRAALQIEGFPTIRNPIGTICVESPARWPKTSRTGRFLPSELAILTGERFRRHYARASGRGHVVGTDQHRIMVCTRCLQRFAARTRAPTKVRTHGRGAHPEF
jgi:hypothetical protein